MSGKEVTHWADPAMFTAEPVDTNGPKVYLLEMTSDPLGSIAALSAMYTGKVIRNKDEVTDEERRHHLEEMKKTKLTTPLESVKLHFMIEGVTRAFTHQLVRNRTSAFAQESMRFAVKEDMPVALPPSLAGVQNLGIYEDGTGEGENDFARLSDAQKMRVYWDDTVAVIRQRYKMLIDMGMPAEDARGLAPTNVLTRINWVTDLRTLIDVLGVRLCTQAQFEWRQVANLIAKAIANGYRLDRRWIWHEQHYGEYSGHYDQEAMNHVEAEYKALASLFRPICYKTGKCEFMSDADRECSIRSRVEANHDIGRSSNMWGAEYDNVDPTEIGVFNPSMRTARGADGTVKFIGAIYPAEWMLDPGAAR